MEITLQFMVSINAQPSPINSNDHNYPSLPFPYALSMHISFHGSHVLIIFSLKNCSYMPRLFSTRLIIAPFVSERILNVLELVFMLSLT